MGVWMWVGPMDDMSFTNEDENRGSLMGGRSVSLSREKKKARGTQSESVCVRLDAGAIKVDICRTRGS